MLRSAPELPFLTKEWNREICRSIKASLASGAIVRGPGLDALEAALRKMFPGRSAVLCGSGSLALEIALRGFGVGPGDDVVVPSFCCSAILRPILAVRATPVFADVGLDLNITAATAEAAFTDKTRAVIVPHLFGNPADVAGVLNVARNKKIGVIDDAAQALGASLDGRRAGVVGDVGVISFGRDKVCSGIGGGVLLTAEGFPSQICQTRLPSPSSTRVLHRVVSTLLWNYRRQLPLPRARTLTLTHASPHEPPRRYRKEGMANLTAEVARLLLERLSENVAKRRAHVEIYRELLGCDARVQLIAHAEGSACLTQVVRVLPLRNGDDRAARVVVALRRSGYDVQGSYIPLHLFTKFAKSQPRRPAYTDRVWRDLIELPCDPGLDINEVARIAEALRRAL